MSTARPKVEALFASIGSHMIEISGTPETTPEYMATLRQLKKPLSGNTPTSPERSSPLRTARKTGMSAWPYPEL